MATKSQRNRIEKWAINVTDCCGPTVKRYNDPNFPEEVTYPAPPPSILQGDAQESQLVRRMKADARYAADRSGYAKESDSPFHAVRRYKSTRERSPPASRKSAPKVVNVTVQPSRSSSSGHGGDHRSRHDARTERDLYSLRSRDDYMRDERTEYRETSRRGSRYQSRKDSPQEVIEIYPTSSSRDDKSRSPKQGIIRRVLRLPERESRKHYYEDRDDRRSRRAESNSRHSRARSMDIGRGSDTWGFGARRPSRDSRAEAEVEKKRYSFFRRPSTNNDDEAYTANLSRSNSLARNGAATITYREPRRASSVRSRRSNWTDDLEAGFSATRASKWGDGFGRWSWGDSHGGEWEVTERRRAPPAPAVVRVSERRAPVSASAWEARRLGRDGGGGGGWGDGFERVKGRRY